MSLDHAQVQTRLVHAGSPELKGGSGPVNVPVVRTSTVPVSYTHLTLPTKA